MVIMCRLYLLSLVYLPVFLLLGTATEEPHLIRLRCGDVKNVTSPNYPQNYPNNERISWTVEVGAGQRIMVRFNNFHTELGDDLIILDVNYPSTEVKYRGNNAFTPYISLGNHLMLTFEPDSSESRMGFHLSISCWKEKENDTVYKAFGDDEYTRILTEPICQDDWNKNVADTICREAGFPGSFETNFTSGIEIVKGSDGKVYLCSQSTFRLQDCEVSTSNCNIAPQSLLIKCNVFSMLGCFDLAQYIHLLTASVQLRMDQCVAHCHSNSVPQYAVYHNGTCCSCINQIDLNFTTLPQERDRCMKIPDSQSLTWATLFNASFGFCEEPPRLNNGSWKSTLDGYMYGSTITAVCGDKLELVGGDRVLKCDKGLTPSSRDFEWHGTIPSCRESDNGNETSEPTSLFIPTQINETDNHGNSTTLHIWLPVSVITAIVIMVIFVVIYIRHRKGKDGDQRCLLPSEKRGDCREICFVRALRGILSCTKSPTKERDPQEEVPTLQKIHRDSDSCVKEQPPKTSTCQV